MRPFDYERAADARAAVRAASVPGDSHQAAPVQYLAGGTTLLDLMKLDVMRPSALVDLAGLDGALAAIEPGAGKLRIGAMARMADVADHPDILRDYPLLSQSLWLAASPQIRNMARVGGNVLQRTRCAYFRDTSYAQCNKRTPGSGCAALDGHNRLHAVLGTSDHCIATYPGDFAQALIALDASVETLGARGPRTLRFADLHLAPGDTPHIETNLAPGELITAFLIPGPWRRSLYRKIRDRESYEFALASAAVALDLDGGTVRDARIALGGVATRPWRSAEAEHLLRGRTFDEAAAHEAAEAAFAGARVHHHNAFKLPLGKACLVRALLEAKALPA